jgi:hypothetical protein
MYAYLAVTRPYGMLLGVNAGKVSAFWRWVLQLQGEEWLLQWGNDSERMKAMREDSSFAT